MEKTDTRYTLAGLDIDWQVAPFHALLLKPVRV